MYFSNKNVDKTSAVIKSPPCINSSLHGGGGPPCN